MPVTELATSHTLIAVCMGEFELEAPDYPLKPVGRAQMADVAVRLRDEGMGPLLILSATHGAAKYSAEILADINPDAEYARDQDIRGYLSGGYPYGTTDVVAEVNRHRAEHADDHRPLVLVVGSGTATKLHEVLGRTTEIEAHAKVRSGSAWQYAPDTRELYDGITREP